MYQIKIKINKNLDSKRLDIALAQSNLYLSRRKIKRLIDIGSVYVNKKRVRIASYIVHEGDIVQVEYDPDICVKLKYPNFELTTTDIIYEDDDVIVINKPAGLPSQPTREQAIVHVISCIKNFYKKQNVPTPKNLILVHRLDKETSGVMIIAKNKRAGVWLSQQFKNQSVYKKYHAICYGVPQKTVFKNTSYISSIHPYLGIVKNSKSADKGKLAITEFRVLSVNKNLNLSLIECMPQTGRSHQIRVHLQSSGYPIVGDKKYGFALSNIDHLPPDLKNLIKSHHFLHARSLSIRLINQDIYETFIAEYPDNFKQFLKLADLTPI